jgi:hypothetical protein
VGRLACRKYEEKPLPAELGYFTPQRAGISQLEKTDCRLTFCRNSSHKSVQGIREASIVSPKSIVSTVDRSFLGNVVSPEADRHDSSFGSPY